MKSKTEEERKQDETLYMLASLIAAYTNPHMFPFDLSTLSEVDRLSELESLKSTMGEIIG